MADEPFVAEKDLIIYNPDAGAYPQVAYRAGQLVAADVIAANPQWRERVRQRVAQVRQARQPDTPVRPAAAPARGRAARPGTTPQGE